MIGAIKRRWKSKKAKVLHKGSELSTSSDTCPTSRGFALDSVDDFDKMLKPPSPRQIHPVLEKGDGSMKYGQLPPLPPTVGGGTRSRKSSTLPPNSEDGGVTCPAFIHVNSGRIELVSKKGSPTILSGEFGQEKLIWRKRSHLLKGNDTRHSWCGSAFRAGADVTHPRKGMVSLVEEDRGPPTPRLTQQITTIMPPSSSPLKSAIAVPGQDSQSQPQQQTQTLALFLNPLRDRLTLIEELTKGLEGLQKEEKSEYERCVSELAGQVSRAVALQQIMKSEVEKLQMRVIHLENNNKAMATMIIPTLMKLHETVVKETPPKSENSSGKSGDDLSGQNQQQNQAQVVQSHSPTKKTPLKSLQSFQSDKELEIGKKNSSSSGEQKSPTKHHRKIGECRIPRMSNGRLNRTQGQFRTNSPNPTKNLSNISSSSSGGNNNSNCNKKEKSEWNKNSNRNNSNNNDNPSEFQTQTSLHEPTPSKTSSTGIPRLASPLNHPKTRKSVNDLPPNPSGSKLPVRKTSSSNNSSGIPTKHPAASSKSLPNQPGSNISNNPSSKFNSNSKDPKPNSAKYSKSTIGFTNPNFKKSPGSFTSSSLSSNGSQQGTRPLQKLGCSTTGKDEGYSTMSSEALAEQEAIIGLKDPKKHITVDRNVTADDRTKTSYSAAVSSRGSSLHKSNTFNTFGELGATSSTSSRAANNSNSPNHNKFIIPPSAKNELRNLKNYTSLPTNTNKHPNQTCYPPSGTKTTTTIVTASVLEPTSITTDHNNVRIVRGSPYEIQFSESLKEDDPSWDDQEISTSTILWEDSDDSDTLFFPIEISSDDLGSQSTLMPHSSSARSSKSSSYTSWTSSTTTNTSGPSHHDPPAGHPYPLRRSKGEDFTNGVPNSKNKASGDGSSLGNNLLIITTSANDDGKSEERALIEKWMRLEDVRNEVQWEEEWAWDWDGVERTLNLHLHNNPNVHNQMSPKGLRSTFPLEGHTVINEEDTEEEEDNLEEFWFASGNQKQQGSPSTTSKVLVSSNNPGETSLKSLNVLNGPSSHPAFSSKETGKDTHEGCSGSPPLTPSNPVQIDSSTWTKSTRNKMRKLLQEQAEDSLGGFLSQDGNEEDEEGLLINENVSHLLLEGGCDGSTSVNQQGVSVPGEDGSSSPPVIEFTPEFYRLANYGSNLSFSDNENGSHPNQPKSPKFGFGLSPRRKATNVIVSTTNGSGANHSKSSPCYNEEEEDESSKMDDKISQTDFQSSFENLSVSSDLFSECRNCLEIIKTLVGHTTGSGESDNSMGDLDEESPGGGGPSNAKRLSEFERRIAEMKADAGCPTTWLSVPSGVPSAEVDRILDILSSSESEDVLSPSK